MIIKNKIIIIFMTEALKDSSQEIIQNNYINFGINGRLFPLYILHNFKQYKLKPIVKIEGEDPCNISTKDEILELREYQKFIGAYLDYRSPFHNILLYHGLGSGKTASAINIYNVLYNYTTGWNVFLLIKASLHNQPWLKDLKTWLLKEDNDGRWENIIFIHYDAPNADKDFLTKVKEADSAKKNLYIIDEAHNFIKNVYNNITNKQGKRAQTIYDYISRDQIENDTSRVILMSGTPAVNQPYELALIFNLLRHNIFPNSEAKFNEIYINSDDKYQLNGLNPDAKNMFQRRILGLVSYYQGATSDLYAKQVPHQKNLVMSEYQLQVYKYYEEIEKKLEANSRPGKKSQSVYKSYTRQASNFVFPVMGSDMSGENRPRPSKFKLSEKEIERLMEGYVGEDIDKQVADRYQLYLDTMNKYMLSFDEYLNKKNQIDKENNISLEKDLEVFRNEYKYKFSEFWFSYKNKSNLLQAMYECSCKMTAILFNSYKSAGPVLIYSNYVKMEGMEVLKIYMKYFGITRLNDEYSNEGLDFHRFTEFTGQIDKELKYRNLIKFNDIKNKDGSKVRFILISPAGAEGISLKNVKQVHVMEPYWNEVRIEQLIGRAIRQCSHKDIPIKDRYVDVYRYNAVSGTDIETTDQEIQKLARSKQDLIDSFLITIKEAAVDCELFKEHNMIDSQYSCFKFNEKSYFEKYIGPAYKDDIYFDKKINNGLNSLNSTTKQIKVVKINAVKKTDKGYSAPESYWYYPESGVVYDYILKYPIGKISHNEGIVNKLDKTTYIIDNIIVIPKIKKI